MTGPRTREFPHIAFLFLLAAVGSSCAPGTREVRPPVALPGSFSQGGSARLPARWWEAFDDPALKRLEEEALRENPGLAVVWSRLRQAEAIARKVRAGLVPALTGTAGFSVSRRRTPPPGGDSTREFSLRLAAGYELDLWGRVRSAARAADLDAAATAEDLQAAAVTLSAEVADTWFRLVEARGELRLLDEQLETNRRLLEALTARFRRGLVSATDVLQQRQLLESTRSERVRIEAEAKALENQLAVLLGRVPEGYKAPRGESLPALPPLPATGLPADWVRRRPDLRAAYLRVRAADQRLAAAIADQFPRVSISAAATASGEKLQGVFDNWLTNLALNLAIPLFEGGRRRAEVDRARWAAAESLHRYRQTLLTALAEVENALQREEHQRRFLQSLQRQLELSKSAVEQIRENYIKGVADFTRFLTALISHQRLERTHLQARRDLLLVRVGLCRALAGPWELTPPAEPPRRVEGPLTRLRRGRSK